MKGALLGLKKKRIEEITQDVINFAEIGDFLYQPVKKYSSGMKSRLGFAISLALNPDIFIVDEALSVGDRGFAKKCMDRMMQLRDDEGKTIFFISHSLDQVKNFCTTGMWIEGGSLVEMGPVNEVAGHYSEYVEKMNAMKGPESFWMRNSGRDSCRRKRKKAGGNAWFHEAAEKNRDSGTGCCPVFRLSFCHTLPDSPAVSHIPAIPGANTPVPAAGCSI